MQKNEAENCKKASLKERKPTGNGCLMLQNNYKISSHMESVDSPQIAS